MIALAAAAFVAIFFLDVPFPLIVLGAGLIGYVGGRAGSAAVPGRRRHGGGKKRPDGRQLLGDELPAHARPTVPERCGSPPSGWRSGSCPLLRCSL